MTSIYEQMAKPWQMPPFSKFSPLNGQVPAEPFQFLPIIADRARKLLSTRSESEIIIAANLIEGMLETYYDQLRGQVIIDLLHQYPDHGGILLKESLDEEDIEELDKRQRDIEDILCGGYIPGIELQVPNIPNRNDVSDIESLKIVER